MKVANIHPLLHNKQYTYSCNNSFTSISIQHNEGDLIHEYLAFHFLIIFSAFPMAFPNKFILFLLILLLLQNAFGSDLRVVTLNIWNGASHGQDGLLKFAKHIAQLNPDIVALQEVYGNGADKLAKLLNEWELLLNRGLRGQWNAISRNCKQYTDTALLTRHKILESADDGCALWGNGAKVLLAGSGRVVNVFGMHLDYVNYGPEMAKNPKVRTEEILNMEQIRVKNIQQLFGNHEFKVWNHSTHPMIGEPLLIMGDFNTPSHLDWTRETSHLHNGRVIAWPTTKLLGDSGFIDAFRAVHSNAQTKPGLTWPFSSKPTVNSGDRLDFVFLKGTNLKPLDAFTYPVQSAAKQQWPFPKQTSTLEWPSDHFALVVDFVWADKAKFA